MSAPTLTRMAAAGVVTLALTAVAVIGPGQAEAESISQGVSRSQGVAPGRSPVPATPATPATPVTESVALRAKAVSLYGRPRSGLPWHTGIWTGLGMSASRTAQAERWAGRPFDFTTVYPGYGSWAEMADSAWTSELMRGYKGRLAYGLPLLPNDRVGQWNDVLSGRYDYVFRKIAHDLRANGRGDAAIRVGIEANGNWFAWGVTAATADEYRAAFRRVVTIMNRESPGLTFWFDLSAGYGLRGQKNRMDALNLLYPGDNYIDGVSMDHYDFWELQAKSSLTWAKAMKPTKGPGLADAAAFARAHHKGFAVPEWGVHGGTGVFAGGDNPYFIQKMHDFFLANRDILVFECYFNEPDAYIRNAIFSPVQMPRSSAAYLRLF